MQGFIVVKQQMPKDRHKKLQLFWKFTVSHAFINGLKSGCEKKMHLIKTDTHEKLCAKQYPETITNISLFLFYYSVSLK